MLSTVALGTAFALVLAACGDDRMGPKLEEGLPEAVQPPGQPMALNPADGKGTATVCMEDVVEAIDGTNAVPLNCTANDLNLFFTIPEGGGLPLCLPGDPLEDLSVEAHFGSGAQNRWDIGLWIREDGTGVPDALRGDCRHWSLVPVGIEGDDGSVLVDGVATRFAPFYNEDGDSCGDLNQAFETVLEPVVLSGLLCNDSDGDGQLDVGACVSYDNNGNQDHDCTDPSLATGETRPNTKSKCSCGPLSIPVNIGGKIIIEKVTVPDTDTDTDFDFDGDDPGDLLDQTIKNGESYEQVLEAGTYNVTETVPSGWELTDITCVDPSGGTTDNEATATASIDLEAGETVTCTFTNTQLGEIIVAKETLPDGDTQSFDFDGPDDFDPSLTDGTSDNLSVAPGQYEIAETVPAGWALTDITCVDATGNSSGDTGTGVASYDVAPGETVTCTFTNTKLGKVIVEKQTMPDGDTQEFTFDGPEDFDPTLTDGQTDELEVLPGNYTVTETNIPAEWMLGSIQCDDGDSTGDTGTATATYMVAAGEEVTCTFTNTEGGTIIVEKQTDPDGSTTEFDFDGPEDFDPTLTDDQTDMLAVVPGTYTVTEMVPENWTLTDISCTDPTGDSSGNTGTATATFEVAAGETITCTFTNTEDAKIIIVKETLPDGDPETFQFDGPGDFDPALADGEMDMVFLDPGQYTVTETVPANWTLTDISCDDSNSTGDLPTATATINLIAGEHVTCTFTNTADAKIIVEKQTLPDGSGQSFDFDGPGDFDPQLTDGEMDMMFVDPGQYTVTEMVPENWTVTDITCDDGDSSGAGNAATYNVDPGEHVKCTFTNTEDAKIIVVKETLPDGDPAIFDFDGPADFDPQLSDGQMDMMFVDPGQYTVTETVPAGWDLTDISCSDGDSSGAGSTATYNVDPGEQVTCTFTNGRLARLVVTKTVVGGGAQVFDFTRTGIAPFTLPHMGSNDSGFTLESGEYEVCELDLAVSWSAAATVDGVPVALDNPDAPEDMGNRCITVDLDYGDDVTVAWENTPPPGGEARTIGYWKNWSSCSNGRQYEKAVADGMVDKTLDGNLPQTIGDLLLEDCEDARNILDKRDLGGKKRANDGAYGLAAQLLAAQLNFSAGAGVCMAATDAANAAQTLLADIDFLGTGQYLRRGAVYNQARDLAATLDDYNNNTLCPA
ncbi:MAG: hypothetical protein HKN73_18825 [Gemmatimonadetes bacterium]|nr:hypothetical protein [Gemmatimonadota bacterium]